MIYASFLVAGVGIGYGVHSGNAAVTVIAVWLFLITCILAFMAGVARVNDTIDRVIAEQFEEDAQQGFCGKCEDHYKAVHYKTPDDLYGLPTAVRGSYPADEDVT